MTSNSNTKHTSTKPTKLSKQEQLALVKLSGVVTAAKDPQAALDDLNSSLSHKYQRPLHALSLMMAGKLSEVKTYGLWDTLKHLIVCSEQSQDTVTTLAYVKQYSLLERAARHTKSLTGYNWLTVGYFTLLTFIILISITIFKFKVLPVYAAMFKSFGAHLPPFTQYILNGGFEFFAIILLCFTIIYCLILPYLFKRALSGLHQMPWYMVIFPAYLLCRRPYRQYCWQTYARVYYRAGDTQPLVTARHALWGSDSVGLCHDDWMLLQVASRQDSLILSLDELEKQLLAKIKSRITMADMGIRLVLLLAFAWMASAPVIAMYLPIFQMGAVVQ